MECIFFIQITTLWYIRVGIKKKGFFTLVFYRGVSIYTWLLIPGWFKQGSVLIHGIATLSLSLSLYHPDCTVQLESMSLSTPSSFPYIRNHWNSSRGHTKVSTSLIIHSYKLQAVLHTSNLLNILCTCVL
jgi:hypothetical protein